MHDRSEIEVRPLTQGSAVATAFEDGAGEAVIFRLARASSQAAIGSLHGSVASRERLASVELFAAGSGRCEAAALVARPLAQDVTEELRLRGSADCCVDVAVVDGSGTALARIAFAYRLGAV